jgi:hypothetical protein
MSHNEKKDWRELAAMASVETDPAKLMIVIAELTEALQEYRKEVTLQDDSNCVGAPYLRRGVLGG